MPQPGASSPSPSSATHVTPFASEECELVLRLAAATSAQEVAVTALQLACEVTGALSSEFWEVEQWNAQPTLLTSYRAAPARHTRLATVEAHVVQDVLAKKAGPVRLATDGTTWLVPLAPANQQPVAALALDFGSPLEEPQIPGQLPQLIATLFARTRELTILRDRADRYRALVFQAKEIILLVDATTLRITDANPFAAHALGYTHAQLIGRDLQDILVSPPATAVDAASDDSSRLPEQHLVRSDGETIAVDVVCSRFEASGRDTLLILARDLTEQQLMDRQLLQAQKMDALGKMAGQVAHDFNNLLATIMGFAGLIRRSPHLDEEDQENVRMIEQAALRAGDLTGRLLSFARGGLVHFGPIDLQTVLADTLRLTEPSLPPNVSVTLASPATELVVEGDAQQLQHAFVNVILNAIDALTESGGAITIVATSINGKAVVSFADNGPGMPESVRQRVFEPFFTTKPGGQGDGLGLAVTYGVVRGHHGTTHLQSSPGAGTVVTIELPLQHRESEPVTPKQLALIVVKDPRARSNARNAVQRRGYATIELSDPAQAPALLAARPRRFSLGVLDSLDDPHYCGTLLGVQPQLQLIAADGPALANLTATTGQ